MKKGIIFDMDGTLWDSARQVADSWSIALQEAGIENKKISASDMYSVMGKTMDEIANILFGELDEKKQKELLHACCEKENDYLRKNGGNLYPKVESTLEKLKSKYHLYIVSNCQSGYIEAFLHYYNFSKYFEDIECFGNNSKIKAENIKIVEPVSPKTKQFVVTIVENRVIDIFRVRSKHPEVAFMEELYIVPEQPENDNYLKQCIRQLPTIQRQVIWLKYYYGYNLHEIAKMLDISLSWAQKIDQRAKKKLREIYAEGGQHL